MRHLNTDRVMTCIPQHIRSRPSFVERHLIWKQQYGKYGNEKYGIRNKGIKAVPANIEARSLSTRTSIIWSFTTSSATGSLSGLTGPSHKTQSLESRGPTLRTELGHLKK